MEPCQKLFQNCCVPGGIFFAALVYLPHLQVCSFLYKFLSAVSGDSHGPDLLASSLSVWGDMSNIYFKLNSLFLTCKECIGVGVSLTSPTEENSLSELLNYLAVALFLNENFYQ